MPDSKAKIRYDAKTAVYFSLKLNRKTDADLIAALEATPNKQAFIKQALRGYIERRTTMNNSYYWDLESWGNGYPPENADEIIDAANAMIDAYAEDHDEEATEIYSEALWDRYCTTGNLE